LKETAPVALGTTINWLTKILLVAVNVILFLLFLLAVVNYETPPDKSDPQAIIRCFITSYHHPVKALALEGGGMSSMG
jgi:uncharacterized protein YggT (Ycf19 family)